MKIRDLIQIFLLLICLSLTFCACSNNNSSFSQQESKEAVDVTEEFEEEGEDKSASEAQKEDYEIPVSNVKDGTGIEGTWKNTAVEGSISTMMVLALNDDSTFKFYVEIIDKGDNPSSGSARGSGVYSAQGDQLKLDFEENPESGEPAQIIDDSTFTFSLEGDLLKLTDSNGDTIEYHRE